jgi:hypothetical protein
MLSIQKIFGHEGGRRERTSDDCVTGTLEQHESPQSLEQFILDRRPDCRGHRPRLQFIQAFNHFLHATDHQREPLVVELVWGVVG